MTANEQRFLNYLSWAAMAGAVVIVFSAGWEFWQIQGRIELIFRGKTDLLPLATRTLVLTPSIAFMVLPAAVAAACVIAQTRMASRVISTLFQLFVMLIGIGGFLIARDSMMMSLTSQLFAR